MECSKSGLERGISGEGWGTFPAGQGAYLVRAGALTVRHLGASDGHRYQGNT